LLKLYQYCDQHELREQFLLSQCSSYLNDLVQFNADYQFYKCLRQIQADKYMWVRNTLNFDYKKIILVPENQRIRFGISIAHLFGFWKRMIWSVFQPVLFSPKFRFLESRVRYPWKGLGRANPGKLIQKFFCNFSFSRLNALFWMSFPEIGTLPVSCPKIIELTIGWVFHKSVDLGYLSIKVNSKLQKAERLGYEIEYHGLDLVYSDSFFDNDDLRHGIPDFNCINTDHSGLTNGQWRSLSDHFREP